jgi:hypothetical protein
MAGKSDRIQRATANPIAAKLIGKMKLALNRKIINLKNFAAGLRTAEELQKQVLSKERLNEFHAAHAAYIYAQNQVSVMSEQLMALKEMAPFTAILSKAEDLYSTSALPMKYGPTRAYWNDFVFEGYVNHRLNVIFLAGLQKSQRGARIPGSTGGIWESDSFTKLRVNHERSEF